MRKQRFDPEKALTVWIYIAERVDDHRGMYHLLYQADKLHLERYGRLIYGERYVAGEDGPVPVFCALFMEALQAKVIAE
ncbi:MAG: hypothetical protein WC145_11645 [Aliarcobacter sp.]|jgi:hypothetical protein